MSGDRIDLLKKINTLEAENKALQDKVDYYKHEYYSECDLRERLEKALNKACKKLEYVSSFKEEPWERISKENWKSILMEEDDGLQ
ncbi:hypothetical protein [Thomasclavelia cocleata]|jgi:hypothetical protein|uniref:hypothetical protein n=1 Tax=Thomasclavelia cocleata TaxID=69824 RepID=UPI00241E14FE|nr:hypothetical protein [Thomasclavelia cocleata]